MGMKAGDKIEYDTPQRQLLLGSSTFPLLLDEAERNPGMFIAITKWQNTACLCNLKRRHCQKSSLPRRILLVAPKPEWGMG